MPTWRYAPLLRSLLERLGKWEGKQFWPSKLSTPEPTPTCEKRECIYLLTLKSPKDVRVALERSTFAWPATLMERSILAVRRVKVSSKIPSTLYQSLYGKNFGKTYLEHVFNRCVCNSMFVWGYRYKWTDDYVSWDNCEYESSMEKICPIAGFQETDVNAVEGSYF